MQNILLSTTFFFYDAKFSSTFKTNFYLWFLFISFGDKYFNMYLCSIFTTEWWKVKEWKTK